MDGSQPLLHVFLILSFPLNTNKYQRMSRFLRYQQLPLQVIICMFELTLLRINFSQQISEEYSNSIHSSCFQVIVLIQLSHRKKTAHTSRISLVWERGKYGHNYISGSSRSVALRLENFSLLAVFPIFLHFRRFYFSVGTR